MSPLDPFGLIGQVLDGQFRVDKFVGEGGFSIVYRGHHLGLDEPIAIKCLKLPNALGSALVESFVRRFRDESRLHYRLSQGNLAIARSIASGTTMSPSTSALVPYMVLEWLEGRSMAQDFEVRRERGLTGRTLDETVKLLDSAALGLAYAHAQGVIHRDINPGNLFIATTRHGVQLKVLDFGVAKIVSDHALEMGPRAPTLGQIRIFAPAYGAPEQFDDAMGKVGAQTDVYSFAMILLEALRDKPVREGEHLGEFAAQALDARLPTPRALGIPVGDAVEAAFARAVAMRASERPADVGELWGNLKHAMRDDATSGQPPYAFDVPRPAVVDRFRSQPPAAGERAITADIPASPAVEVTRSSVVPPNGPLNAPGGGSRQLHRTVRMESAPPRPSGAASTSVRPLAATVALGATVPLNATSPLKSTLVMAAPAAARNTPLPPTARAADGARDAWSPSNPDGSYSGPPPVNSYGSVPNLNSQGSVPSLAAAANAPGSAYGPPPLQATQVIARADGPPTTPRESMSGAAVAEPRKRGPLVLGLSLALLVLVGAAAFGIHRATAGRRGDSASAAAAPTDSAPATPTSALTVTTGNPLEAPVADHAGSGETPVGAASAEPAASAAPAPTASTASTPPTGAAPSRPAAFGPSVTGGHGGGGSSASSPVSPPSPAVQGAVAPASAPLTAPLDPRAFNPVAAKAALDVVDGILASCRRPGGKTGDGHITVTFANDGQVAHAVIDEPPFAGSPEASCVSSRMRHARVKAFDGAPGTIVYDFHIPR